MYDIRMRPIILFALFTTASTWHVKVSWSSTITPRSFSAWVGSSCETPADVVRLYVVFGLLFTRCIVLHFLALKVSCQVSAQLLRAVRSSWSWEMPSVALTLVNSLASSANIYRNDFTTSGMSLTKITKRSGPSTLPCGIPLVTGAHAECVPLMTTLCWRLLRKSRIHFSAFPFIPWFSTFRSSPSWGTLSNALAKSR